MIIVRKTIWLLLFLASSIALLLTASCGPHQQSMVTPGSPKNRVMLSNDEREKAWEGLAEPHQTFEAYVKALRKSEYLKAAAYIYMQNRDVAEATVSELMPELSKQILEEDWKIKIVLAAREGRFAVLIFTTSVEEDDPSPILMIQEDNHWYMHHYQHSGRLANLLDDEGDYAQALQLIDWGKRNVQKLQNEIEEKKDKAAAELDKKKPTSEKK